MVLRYQDHRFELGSRTLEESPIAVLLVEDDEDEVLLLTEAMEDAGATDIAIVHAARHAAAMEILKSRAIDAVLLDLSLPDSNGIDGVESLVPAAGEAPVIVCTGLNDQDVAQDAIRAGAQDYLVKNPKLYGAVPRILRYAVERSRLVHTANRKVEQARKYTAMLLTKVISVADSGLGITDEQGNFSLVNPALADLVGCAPTDLNGRNWTEILPNISRKPELKAYRESLNGELDFKRDGLKIQRLDGSTIEMTMRSVFLTLGEGNPCRVLSFSNPSKSDPKSAAVARTEKPAAVGDAPKPKPAAAGRDDQFTSKVMQRASDGSSTVAASRIQMVGLQDIKAEFGDRWEKVSKRIFGIADTIITKHLSADDTFKRNNAGDVFICFASLTEGQAWAKAQTISQEIRQAVLGDRSEDVPEDLRLGLILNPDSLDVRSETHSIELSSSDLESSTDLGDLVSDKIKASAARVRASTQSMLAELHKTCRTRLREVHKRDRRAASILIHDLDYDSRRLNERLMSTAGDDPNMMAEVDFIILGNAAEKIYGLNVGKRPLVAVDVHYTTLNDSILCNKYLSICQSLDKMATSSLVFNIKGVPLGIHNTKMAWCASALRPYSRLRMLHIRRPNLGSLDLKEADISLLSVDHADIMSVFYCDLNKAKDFVKQVHDSGARILVDRVTSANGGHLFRDLNIDFISYELKVAMVA